MRRLLAAVAGLVLAAAGIWSPGMVVAVSYLAPRFPKVGLYPLDGVFPPLPPPLNSPLVDRRPMALGDWNGDSFVDLFVLEEARAPDRYHFSPLGSSAGSAEEKRRRLSVYCWEHDLFRFTPSPCAQIHLGGVAGGSPLVNVVPGDFNKDGQLDALLMFSADSNASIEMFLFYGNRSDFDVQSMVRVDSAKESQPFVLDFQGSMKLDMLGVSEKHQSLALWKNVPTNRQFEVISAKTARASIPSFCRPSSPHSNAFVDLDGDCIADLLLTCIPDESSVPGLPTFYQIWVNRKNDGFQLAQQGPLPSGIGHISVADMDGDGAVDLAYSVCPSTGNCMLHITYNQQKPLCNRKTSENCRSAKDLCSSDNNFKFDFTDKNSNVQIRLDALAGRGEEIRVMDQMEGAKSPIQLGDISLDGYPDGLVVLRSSKGSHALLLQNVPCEKELCSSEATAAGRRTFKPAVDGADTLAAIDNVNRAVFVDLDEKGTLDIMLVVWDAHSKAIYPKFLFNNFMNDAFFLKTLVSNGACGKTCEQGGYKPLGVNFPGATFKYTVLNTQGYKRAAIGCQLPQSAYGPLLTPYTLLGLGRTNNYVEEFAVGVPYHQPETSRTWAGIIPNSQLIVLPFQPEVQSPESWSLQLFISPSEYTRWVLLSVIISMLLLSVVILVLKRAEMREDELEKRKALHHINFDAL